MRRFLTIFFVCFIVGVGFVFSLPERKHEIGKRECMRPEIGPGYGERESIGPEIGPKHEMGKLLKLRKELNLTDEQVKTLEKINMDYKKEEIKKQTDIKIIRLELAETLRQNKPDFAAVRSKVKQIAEIQLDLKLAMIDAIEKGFNVLTEEQHEKLNQLKKEQREPIEKFKK